MSRDLGFSVGSAAVAKKVCIVQTSMSAKYRIIHCLTNDSLAGIPILPTHLPDFVPGIHYT